MNNINLGRRLKLSSFANFFKIFYYVYKTFFSRYDNLTKHFENKTQLQHTVTAKHDILINSSYALFSKLKIYLPWYRLMPPRIIFLKYYYMFFTHMHAHSHTCTHEITLGVQSIMTLSNTKTCLQKKNPK